ncbi:MAG TPA: hypothetical protein VKZ54_02185, partial [Membranihabitans sp.]|nr:hypothetical protein [Membranihabitans sp.]
SAFSHQLSAIGITPKIEIVYIDRVRKLNPLNLLNHLNHLNHLNFQLSAFSYQLSAVRVRKFGGVSDGITCLG